MTIFIWKNNLRKKSNGIEKKQEMLHLNTLYLEKNFKKSDRSFREEEKKESSENISRWKKIDDDDDDTEKKLLWNGRKRMDEESWVH